MTDWMNVDPTVMTKVLLTALVVLVGWLARLALLKAVFKKVDEPRARYLWLKATTYVFVVLVLVAVARIWFEAFGSMTTTLGLLSAGLAIALKDLVADVAGWVFILWRRPFEVGDRIQIGGHSGDVIDVRIFQFTLLEIGNWVRADQSTGRVIHVPNWKVFSDTLANYSKGFQYIWDELPVLVTFESDWRGAKAILQAAGDKHAAHLTDEAAKRLREASGRFMIFYETLTPKVYTSVEESGVLLTLRYLCEPKRRRGVREAIWEDVLDAFDGREDVDFAYPTRRLFDNRTEGKPGEKRP